MTDLTFAELGLAAAREHLRVLRDDPEERRLFHHQDLMRKIDRGGISIETLGTTWEELTALSKLAALADAKRHVEHLRSESNSAPITFLIELIARYGVRPVDAGITREEILRHLGVYLKAVEAQQQ